MTTSSNHNGSERTADFFLSFFVFLSFSLYFIFCFHFDFCFWFLLFDLLFDFCFLISDFCFLLFTLYFSFAFCYYFSALLFCFFLFAFFFLRFTSPICVPYIISAHIRNERVSPELSILRDDHKDRLSISIYPSAQHLIDSKISLRRRVQIWVVVGSLISVSI